MGAHVRSTVWIVVVCALAGIGLGLLVIGCATIIHGTTQDVGFSSTPSGATVTVDNTMHGNTPAVVKLSRKDNHMVKIELLGYKPFEATITRSVSGWVWGNIVFGGLIGLAVDAITGGLYKLTPEQIAASLSKGDTGFLYQEDAIYVAVVLRPDPTWQRIETMDRTGTQ
jgi:hypothetical protein